MLIDTHCHIHEADYPLNIQETIEIAHRHEVLTYLCVGTSEQSSRDAVRFAAEHEHAFAIIGVHPHEAKDGCDDIGSILSEAGARQQKIVGIGEIGLDYYYNHSSREEQIAVLKQQIEYALRYGLPISFHVRDAFDDFWPIFDSFTGIRGVLHSFTDSAENLQKALDRGLYIGVNGISTFTKDEKQRAVFASIPLESMLLETDAPFLTPVPFRGTVNQPAYVKHVAEFHAQLRTISVEAVAEATTANARTLFAL